MKALICSLTLIMSMISSGAAVGDPLILPGQVIRDAYGNPIANIRVVNPTHDIWIPTSSTGSGSNSTPAAQPTNTAPAQPVANSGTNQPATPPTTPQVSTNSHPQVMWQALPGKALDISVAANGVAWAVGLDAKIYRWNGAKWDLIPGADGARIAATAEGNAWAASRNGTLWRFDGVGFVNQRGPKALDIACGADGSLWMIDERHQVQKLHLKGIWQHTGGKGNAIAVAPDGTPWMVAPDSSVWQLKGKAPTANLF